MLDGAIGDMAMLGIRCWSSKITGLPDRLPWKVWGDTSGIQLHREDIRQKEGVFGRNTEGEMFSGQIRASWSRNDLECVRWARLPDDGLWDRDMVRWLRP
jgi:hypothetical protein